MAPRIITSLCAVVLFFNWVCSLQPPWREPSVKALTSESMKQFINTSDVRMLYFYVRKESSNVRRFLREFNEAAKQLESYDVFLGTYDCSVSFMDHYCSDERVERMAYGFRDGKEKIALPIDTLADVHAIVASALHLTLIHVVPIVQSLSERKELEERCKGRCDIVFSFHAALGTFEHRVFMEAAYRFLPHRLFAMTTFRSGITGLRAPPAGDGGPSGIDSGEGGGSDSDGREAVLWLLQCAHLTGDSGDCIASVLHPAYDLHRVTSFISCLDLPLWLESSDLHVPEYSKRGLHLVFLFYDTPSSENAVRQTAPLLARAFRGTVGVVIVNKATLSSSAMSGIGLSHEKVEAPAVAFRASRPGATTGLLNAYDDAYDFVIDQLSAVMEAEVQESSPPADASEYRPFQNLAELQQDDEVTQGQAQWQTHGFTVLPTLSLAALDKYKIALVIYYIEWNPVCQEVLRIGSMVAKSLPEETAIFSSNCFDNPKLCNEGGITEWPTLRFFRNGKLLPKPYRGMLDSNSILQSINLYLAGSPFVVHEKEQMELMLTKDLVIFAAGNWKLVTEVAQELEGQKLIVLVQDEAIETMLERFQCKEPCVAIWKNDLYEPFVTLEGKLTAEELHEFISQNSLPVLGELTALNFPMYNALQKTLVILLGSSDQQRLCQIIGPFAAKLKSLSVAWMDRMTNAGQILQSAYAVKKIPTLVGLNRTSAKVYVFPEQIEATPQMLSRVREWLSMLNEGTLQPTGAIKSGPWKPLHPGFDYLKFIDEDQEGDGEDRLYLDAELEIPKMDKGRKDEDHSHSEL